MGAPSMARGFQPAVAVETIERQIQVVAQVPREKCYVEPVGNRQGVGRDLSQAFKD